MNLQLQKEEILTTINFRRIRSVMKRLKWTYGTSPETPSIDELQETAAQHIDWCIERFKKRSKKEQKDFRCSTRSGGFCCSLDRGALTLDFVLDGHTIYLGD